MKTLQSFQAIAVSFIIGVITTVLFIKLYPSSSKNQICISYEKDDIPRITLDELMEDAARYRDTHAKPAQDAMRQFLVKNSTASRSCYYSVETLKKFLYYVEVYSKKHNIDPNNLAINFYYTVYPETKIMPDGKEYGSMHSLYLVPSKLNSESNGYDDFDVISNQTIEQLTANDTNVSQKPGTTSISKLKETRIFAIAPQYAIQTTRNAMTSNLTGSPLMRNLGGLCPCPPSNTFTQIDATYPSVGFK
jgi:hypothetical protein